MIYLANNPYRTGDIYHHGIKGQRWGVRRFQNLDGTLTAEGRRRYGSDISKNDSESVRKQFERHKRFSGTKSLLGGDHTKDEAAKVYKEYAKQAEKNRRDLMKKVDKSSRNDPDSHKDNYRNTLKENAEPFIDRFAKATLRDIGYEDNDKNLKWLKNQYWFGMPIADIY